MALQMLIADRDDQSEPVTTEGVTRIGFIQLQVRSLCGTVQTSFAIKLTCARLLLQAIHHLLVLRCQHVFSLQQHMTDLRSSNVVCSLRSGRAPLAHDALLCFLPPAVPALLAAGKQTSEAPEF